MVEFLRKMWYIYYIEQMFANLAFLGDFMDRVILHSDMNSFYASVECVEKPWLKDVPMVVGGKSESRHGIVLAKNILAKKLGVQTGEPIWQARLKCGDLVVVPPDFNKYRQFSKMARDIYLQYTDRFEPYGIDEGWLDVTHSLGIFGNGEKIAYEIKDRIKNELGVTVSVGVSWNKVFAKLGSDYKKPDAVTVFNKQNYKSLVYPLPVGDLLYVGRATEKKLNLYGIYTIGDLATADVEMLEKLLGKCGYLLHNFATGNDNSTVRLFREKTLIKSVGNSTTTSRDLINENEVKIIFTVLADTVAMRLRKYKMYGLTVRIQIKDNDFQTFSRQCRLDNPTCLSSEILRNAVKLFRLNYKWSKPVRALGITVADLIEEKDVFTQCDIFDSESKKEKKLFLEKTVDGIRERYGNFAIGSASLLTDKKLSGLNLEEENEIFSKFYK